MNYHTRMDVTVHECDKTGRHYVRFTPVITPRVCASGELRTATHDAWIDEPGAVIQQKAAALANAEATLAYLFGAAACPGTAHSCRRITADFLKIRVALRRRMA